MRERTKTFEDWMVWEKAHQFVLAVYRLTRSFRLIEAVSKLLEAYSRAILNSAFLFSR